MERIHLNLLPEEVRALRATKLPMWVSFNFFSIPLAFLLISIVVDLLLFILLLWTKADIEMITNKKNTLYPQRQEQKRLEDYYNSYKKIIDDRTNWGQIMNVISDCLPQVGWFYKFDYSHDEGILKIKGSFYSKNLSKGFTGRFVSCLNGKPVIKDMFSAINVKQITQRKIGQTQVKDFYIECVLKDKDKR